MLNPRRRRSDLDKVSGVGPVSYLLLVISSPNLHGW